ncbi:hypothetical protein SBOR_1854 [Sclerotinia borealis F-4128]|uniref:Retrovirus-related Pol polyprotein from transposon TNT 1-94-like beta-barrel domain-containing protein n=1 Tax=Sclerotinia borealis (strain F-4128) TaxID=1432307 RepID=W9CLV5_SCLBF|nr:hypothetical protein SBOR_1854 [Sclerotinia borealis F-4128]
MAAERIVNMHFKLCLLQKSDGGTIVIFNNDNWNEFYESCLGTLAAADALAIVQGDEEEPIDPLDISHITDLRAYKKKHRNVISIINSAVNSVYHSSLVPFLATSDIVGMWNKLKEHNYTVHPQYITEVRKQFHFEDFNPKTQTLCQFLECLLNYQSKTSISDRAISDQERNFIINSNQSLQEAMVTLTIAEKPYSAITNYTEGKGYGENRGGHNRNRKRSGYRGGSGGNGGDSGGTSNNRIEKVSKDQCRFCLKKGNFQKDYRSFLKAKKATQGIKADKEDNKEGMASLAIGDQYNGTIYTGVAMRATDSKDYTWILDSGVSNHFTRILKNLDHFQYWKELRRVRIANNTCSINTGFGKTKIGRLILDDIWYVKDFRSTQLISITQLADAGSKVIFERDSGSCWRFDQLQFAVKQSKGSYIYQYATIFDIAHLFFNEEGEGNLDETNAELAHRRLGHLNYN